ncbi:endo-1,4-beta-xylanase [Granulosicoccus sp.]|nr:endo-1,4-beta-xylanase [Granulosicoccus sp.]
MAANFSRFADLGLDIYITELDVTMAEDSDENQGSNPTPSASVCTRNRFNVLWFEYDADNDTEHSLRNQFVNIGAALNYSNADSRAVAIQVQDVSNRNRPQDLNLMTNVELGDVIKVTPQRNNTTIRFILTVGDQEQIIEMRLTCNNQNQLQVNDEFGPITFLRAVE